MENALRDIRTTREILTGERRIPIIMELDENLGGNSIGHRYIPHYIPHKRTSQNRSIPA